MRKVLSLSLPEKLAREIKKNSRERGFDSVSSYVKYLFEMDKDLIPEKELLNSIKSSRKEYKEGKTVKAKSMTDLL